MITNWARYKELLYSITFTLSEKNMCQQLKSLIKIIIKQEITSVAVRFRDICILSCKQSLILLSEILLTSFAGMLKLDIQPCVDEIAYSLTPDLYRIDPYPDDRQRPTKEVVEFSPKELFETNVLYRWVKLLYGLYIYAQKMDMYEYKI